MYYKCVFFLALDIELGPLRESVLALQDLRPSGFRGGPRLVLDDHHLRLMLRQIAQFHSFSYALKILEPARFQELVSGILPMPFLPSGQPGDTANLYTVLYNIAISRFLAYARRTSDRRSAAFLQDVDNLDRRYGKNPVALLEHLGRNDNVFSVIQHGDYNRNNVLFKYVEEASSPTDVRMLDFQVTYILYIKLCFFYPRNPAHRSKNTNLKHFYRNHVSVHQFSTCHFSCT